MQIIDIEVSLSVPVKVGEETIELGELYQKENKDKKEEKVCKDSFESLQQIFDNRFFYFKFMPAEFKYLYNFHEFCIDTLLVPLWFKYKDIPEDTDFVIFDGDKTITLILRCLSYNVDGFRNYYKKSLRTISAQDIAQFEDAQRLYGGSVGKLMYSYLDLFKKMISNNTGFRRMKEVKKGLEFINTHEIKVVEIGYGRNSVTEDVTLSISDRTQDALLTKYMKYLDMSVCFPLMFDINNIVYYADHNEDCEYEFIYPYGFEQLGFRGSSLNITITPSRYADISNEELESLKPKRKIIFENGVRKEIRRIINKKPNDIFHGSPGIYIIKDLPDQSDTKRNIEYLIEVLYRRNWIASDQLFRIGHSSAIISNKKVFTKRKSFFINQYCSPASNLIIEISDIHTNDTDEIAKDNEDENNRQNTVYTEEDLNQILSVLHRQSTVTIFFITDSYKVSTKLEELIYSNNFYPINLMGRINLDDVEEYNTKKQEDMKDHILATLVKRGYDKSKIKLPNSVIEGITEQNILFKSNEYYKQANIISNMNIITSYNNKIIKEMDGIKKKEPKSPEKELKSMIGLSGIKATVKDIVNNIVLKKTLMDRNIPLENACMHMMFYGNPGTAKTTIARLVARILKKKGVLKTAKFKETGRQDLVDQYVGWTAKKVEELIQKMRGGVLFIDEAYSLVEDRKSFASEAIDTLIQQMELIKKDTIIILAGYPDKMEELLDMNPGFRSRIAFHVKFPNYTKEELIDILKLMAAKQKLILSEEYLEEVSNQLPKYMGSKDFGNGRFMRNLLEQSIMKLSTRLANKYDNFSIIDTKTLTTLTKDDVAFDQIQKKNKNVIGFAK